MTLADFCEEFVSIIRRMLMVIDTDEDIRPEAEELIDEYEATREE